MTLSNVFNVTPNGGFGGFWQSGGGPARDASNNVYVTKGTGTFDTNAPVNCYGTIF